MRKQLTLGAWLVASLLPAVGHAAHVAMTPVQCTNLSPGECDAVGAVFANAFESATGGMVARPPLPASTDQGAPAAPMIDPAATEHLRVTAIRLTSRISMRAALVRPDGAPIHAVEMTMTTLDDLPPAADRMSRALVYRTSVVETMTLNNVTRTEGARKNRTSTEKVMGFKTSFIIPYSTKLRLDPMLALQFDGRFESERYFLEFGAGVAIPSDSNDDANVRGYGGLFAEFGASAYLGPLGSPFYVGGGVIPRLFFGPSDGGVMAAFYAQAGYMFMRTSSTRLYAELRIAQNAMPVRLGRSYDSYSGTSVARDEVTTVYPTELGVQIGIGW